MSAERKCPQCGKVLPGDGPQGQCPECLIKAALPSQTGGAATAADVNAGELTMLATPGTRVQYFGDYELIEEIARGGMGVVWKARQTSLNRNVALKMIRTGALASAEEVERFLREAEAAANLQHPNIVAIHEVGEHNGQHYFTMDYVAGRDLASLVKDGPLSPDRAARYVKIIAEAIHFAHQRGTLHRDLKPSNVLIDESDQPRITDFGLAKLMKEDSGLTQTGTIMGSPSYMSPEQAAGRNADVGPASDVYSLGAMLYELLTGRPPFRAATALATLHDVMETEPAEPRAINPNVPPDLETICLKCLEKAPTARALAEELDRFLNGEPIEAKPASAVRKTVSWIQQHPGTLAALAAFVIVGLGFGLYYLFEENAFLRAQQVDPTLIRVAGVRHDQLGLWSAINYFCMIAGIYALLAVSAKARGLSFTETFDPSKHLRPMEPIGDPMRTLAICTGLACLGTGTLLLIKLIQAFVWEGESLLGHMLPIYGSTYFGLAAFGLVVRDYWLVQYGRPSRQVTPEQLQAMSKALEDYDLAAAITIYREAFPEASLAEAQEYVVRLAETLRAQHPDKYVPPTLSLATLNWNWILITGVIEAICMGIFWAIMPPARPAAFLSQFAFGYLLGAGMMAGTRVSGFLYRMLLVVPAFVAIIVSEAILRQPTEGMSRDPLAYTLGIILGVAIMVSAFTRSRSAPA
ncbi:MAG: serine/threonine protein kinase [Planctomycetes bacterium]|nr:serine/threonine protein kinase [Planctomycetota bacterium]